MVNRVRPILNIKTWTAGDVVTAGDLNEQGRNHITFLSDRRPHASAENRISDASIPNNEWTKVPLDTVLRDTESGFNSDGVYTVQVSGWYYVTACVTFAGNGTNSRGLRFSINGAPAVSGACVQRSTANVVGAPTLTRMIPLVKGNELTVQCWQDSGVALPLRIVYPEVSYMDILFYSQFFGYGG